MGPCRLPPPPSSVARGSTRSKAKSLPQAYLPDIQDVMRLSMHLVRIEDQIAVSPVQKAIPLVLHGDQLQAFYPPDLGIEGDTVPRRWGESSLNKQPPGGNWAMLSRESRWMRHKGPFTVRLILCCFFPVLRAYHICMI